MSSSDPVVANEKSPSPSVPATPPLPAPPVSTPAPAPPAPVPPAPVPVPPVPPAPVPPPVPAKPAYDAFGDSITYGLFLLDPATQSYPSLVAQAKGFELTNLGLSGALTCDVMPVEVFPDHAKILTAPALTTLLTGTNDVDKAGTGLYEEVFSTCEQAVIAWLGLLDSDRLRATSPLVTSSGPSHIETANGWFAIFTDAPGASVTFPINHAAAGPVYAWYRITEASTGTFTYAVDAMASEPLANAPITGGLSINLKDSVAFLRIPYVSAGSHTLTFTQTSNTGSAGGILAIAAPPPDQTSRLPLVLVGTVPKQVLGQGGGACALDLASDWSCLEYTADITANVSQFAKDGLNVQLFDSRKYVSGTPADMRDSLHPNLVGNQEIARGILELLP